MLITKKQDARCMKPSDDCMKRTFTQNLLVYCSPCELIAYTKQKKSGSAALTKRPRFRFYYFSNALPPLTNNAPKHASTLPYISNKRPTWNTTALTTQASSVV